MNSWMLMTGACRNLAILSSPFDPFMCFVSPRALCRLWLEDTSWVLAPFGTHLAFLQNPKKLGPRYLSPWSHWDTLNETARELSLHQGLPSILAASRMPLIRPKWFSSICQLATGRKPANFFVGNNNSYKSWVWPPHSNRNHQDYYIFSRESRTKPSFPTVTVRGPYPI